MVPIDVGLHSPWSFSVKTKLNNKTKQKIISQFEVHESRQRDKVLPRKLLHVRCAPIKRKGDNVWLDSICGWKKLGNSMR